MTGRLGAIPDAMEQNMQSLTRQERYSRSFPVSHSAPHAAPQSLVPAGSDMRKRRQPPMIRDRRDPAREG
jgi:hypothetical protein